jgi:hypothetical protein
MGAQRANINTVENATSTLGDCCVMGIVISLGIVCC